MVRIIADRSDALKIAVVRAKGLIKINLKLCSHVGLFEIVQFHELGIHCCTLSF
jgi:hypothetical protein